MWLVSPFQRSVVVDATMRLNTATTSVTFQVLRKSQVQGSQSKKYLLPGKVSSQKQKITYEAAKRASFQILSRGIPHSSTVYLLMMAHKEMPYGCC